jgi:hypothetical protein
LISSNARKAGATQAELTEAAMILCCAASEAPVTHAIHGSKGINLFQKESGDNRIT